MGNHELFLQHLEKSEIGIDLLFQWLIKKGYPVMRFPSTKAKTHSEWKDNIDKGDIYILQRIEGKVLGVSFSGIHDWPFFDEFLVCAKHSYDNAIPKPFAYIIISSDGKCAGIVKGDTYSLWYITTKKDSRYENIYQEFYAIKTDKVNFIKL